ncbi:hypothetical protein Osc2_12430 [Ruminococcus sp. 25CYCFAH16]
MSNVSKDKRRREEYGWQSMAGNGSGISLNVPCVRLPDDHKCKGCIWYSRDTDVLYCPFARCIRKGSAKNAD